MRKYIIIISLFLFLAVGILSPNIYAGTTDKPQFRATNAADDEIWAYNAAKRKWVNVSDIILDSLDLRILTIDTLSVFDKFLISGGNGSSYNYKTITEEVTIAVASGLGGVATAGNLAPAYSLIRAIAFRVTQAPGGGATELDIGITGGDLDAYIDGASCDILGETGDFYTNGSVGAPILHRAAATTLTLTTDANVTVSDMKIRVVVWYEDITVPAE